VEAGIWLELERESMVGLVARILASGWTCFDLYRPRYDVTVLVDKNSLSRSRG